MRSTLPREGEGEGEGDSISPFNCERTLARFSELLGDVVILALLSLLTSLGTKRVF
ncbi:MAG: hypothetical protein HYV26_10790 [Candidatus Hydrogenedentes bacterium]|nr:hypothetical protein [Candidatus Hydrogenedentota bacterium]